MTDAAVYITLDKKKLTLTQGSHSWGKIKFPNFSQPTLKYFQAFRKAIYNSNKKNVDYIKTAS